MEIELGPIRKKTGRPSSYTQAVADEICRLMSEGRGLRAVCELEGMPHRTVVLRWVENDEGPGFREQYARAREALYDWIAEEIVRISDDAGQDYFIEDRNGQTVVVPDHARVQRDRLRVDSRKWLLSKLAKRYSDKPEFDEKTATGWQRIERTIVGPDDSPPEPAREPRQLTYRKPEMPADLTEADWSVMLEVLELVKRTIPTDSDKPAEEVFGVMRKALLAHFA